MSKDYYKTLGVDKNASEEEIKKAYRKMAHQYHPDKKGGDEAKFKEVNEAYQTLSDKNKRSQYDQFGQTFSGAGGGPGGFGGFNPNDFSGAGFGFNQGGINFEGDLGDIFEGIFGGGFGARRKAATNTGSDIKINLVVSLEEVATGIEKDLVYKTMVKCETCSGLGHEKDTSFKTCSKCNGQGEIKENRRSLFGVYTQVVQCDSCFGKGKIAEKTCKDCRGNGRIKGEKKIKVKIQKGITSGQVIKVAGGGEDGERGAPSGNLYVEVIVQPHKVFHREGAHLFIEKEISVVQALLGDEIEITNLGDKKLDMKIPAGTESGEVLRLRGKGLPYFGGLGHGDLLVKIKVKIPKKISKKAKELLKELDKEV